MSDARVSRVEEMQFVAESAGPAMVLAGAPASAATDLAEVDRRRRGAVFTPRKR